MTATPPAPPAERATPADGVSEPSTRGASTLHRPLILVAVTVPVLAAALIWLPSTVFYLTFQRPLLARGEDSLVLTSPVHRSAGEGPRWQISSERSVPVPPGEIVSSSVRGNALLLEFREGTLAYEWLPRGTIGRLLAHELRILGEATPGPSTDVAVLREILEQDVRAFDFSWSSAERSRHAALVLCRMLLWEDEPVNRIEFTLDSAAETLAAVVVYARSGAKVVRAGREGVLVIHVSPESDSAWTASPAAWIGAAPGHGSTPPTRSGAPARGAARREPE